MILDAAAGQVLSSAQAITVTAASTNVYDTAGVGVGNAAPDIYGATFGQATVYGNDLGTGGPLASGPQLVAFVGTAFTAGGAGTLQVELQSAIDNGSNQPGTWQTILQTDTYALATLTANRKIADFTVPPQYPGTGLPRFYRLNYVVGTGPMTAGTVSAFLATGIDNPIFPSANY